jgi:IS5 family transposase
MVKFRKRFKAERLARINELILAAEQEALQKEKEEDDDDHNNDDQGGSSKAEAELSEDIVVEETTPKEKPNQGTIILDATCTPADLRYPTDLGLLNEAREKLDEIIDSSMRPMVRKQEDLELTE